MPKNKNSKKSSSVSSNTSKTVETPKVEVVEQGKEVTVDTTTPAVSVVSPPPPVSSSEPTSAPASGEIPKGKPFVVPNLPLSDLKLADLKTGAAYWIVKGVGGTPEGHFPEIDRTLMNDAAVRATFLRVEEMASVGTVGIPDKEVNETNRAAIEAATTRKNVAVFDDGRSKFAAPVFSTVPENDVQLLVFPMTDEGKSNAEQLAEFFTARSFAIGWNVVLGGLQRETLIRSANTAELLAWFDKQGMGTLRSAAACYGLNVKSTFSKGVDLTAAREIIKDARKKLGENPSLLTKMAVEYTAKRAEWEAERKLRDNHPVLAKWEGLLGKGTLHLALHEYEMAQIEATKAAAVASREPRATAASATPKVTEDGKSIKMGKKELSIDEMRKLIAVADSQNAAREAAEATAAAVAKAEADAVAAKKKQEEAEKAKANSIAVTSTKATTPEVATPKAKVKAKKLALPKSGDSGEGLHIPLSGHFLPQRVQQKE